MFGHQRQERAICTPTAGNPANRIQPCDAWSLSNGMYTYSRKPRMRYLIMRRMVADTLRARLGWEENGTKANGDSVIRLFSKSSAADGQGRASNDKSCETWSMVAQRRMSKLPHTNSPKQAEHRQSGAPPTRTKFMMGRVGGE